MGLGRLRDTCAALVAGGRPASTPAAVVSHATLPDQRVVTGTLADLADRVEGEGIEPPALLVVGDVVARRVESPPSVASAGDLADELGEAIGHRRTVA
jgi:siroheme synthase